MMIFATDIASHLPSEVEKKPRSIVHSCDPYSDDSSLGKIGLPNLRSKEVANSIQIRQLPYLTVQSSETETVTPAAEGGQQKESKKLLPKCPFSTLEYSKKGVLLCTESCVTGATSDSS